MPSGCFTRWSSLLWCLLRGVDMTTPPKICKWKPTRSMIFFTWREYSLPPRVKIIQQGLIDYTASVYNDELKRMAQANISLHSNRAMARLITVFYEMDEKSIPNKELYADALKRLDNLAQYRRLRIFAGNNAVPPVIWL